MSDESQDDNVVGFCKPPRKNQWQKGQSGNPKGRKKGSRGLKADLHDALNTSHTIKINGKVYNGKTQSLAMMGLALRAASGDLKAQKYLTDLILAVFGPEDRGREQNRLSAIDQELLDRFLRDDDDGDDSEGGEEGAVDG